MITKDTYKNKNLTLRELRHAANQNLDSVRSSTSSQKSRALLIGNVIKTEFASINNRVNIKSTLEGWSNEDLLLNKLNLNYCYNLVMLEFRQKVWPYDYMAFSRRIGELWEPFCRLCFEIPTDTNIEMYTPPSFLEVKRILGAHIDKIANDFSIPFDAVKMLKENYEQVWGLVTSGEISTKLDLHFRKADTHYNIDFKSGFNSNEKGNTNRLLLVASVYKTIFKERHECALFVRAKEEENNHYLQILKKSPHWNVYCGTETYEMIHEYSGFNLSKWIENNLSWLDDLDPETTQFLTEKNLVKYLTW